MDETNANEITIEQQWADGYHTSSNGSQQKLSDLPVPYLKNIINKYGARGKDTTILEGELSTREESADSQDNNQAQNE